jgi:D-3-phosphoglycerate dehydrogenase
MARVNERFSAAGINIASQYLRTNEEVGYVVIDVDSTASQVALEELCAVPGTIRCRILY